MNNDDKYPLHRDQPTRPNPHWRLRSLALVLGLVVLGVVMANTRAPTRQQSQPLARDAAPSFERKPLAIPDRTETPPGDAAARKHPGDAALRWRQSTVQPGDTLGQLLRKAGFNPRTIHQLVTTTAHGSNLARIHPGERFRFAVDHQGRLQRLVHEVSNHERLVFDRDDEGFESARVEERLERRLEHATGTIQTSLFAAGAKAGLSDAVISELVRIFGWDIDFVLDVRRGDRFTVLYEAFYKDGDHVRDGAIIAAEFVNDGRRHRAVRYTDPQGRTAYYAPDGTSMRKAFLRSPVEFTRISSGYGQRYHPVLGRMRNHHGVDYAAPPGTPIRATGDGVVAFSGRNGGYGNFLLIRHGGRYSTAYGHLSHFARGVDAGTRVKQGQVIGYVGNTGRSTGPHLHYEFRIHGVHKNPLKVEFPAVDPIGEQQMARFRQRTSPPLAKLETLGRAYAHADP